jgi:hypothetical protein
MAYLASNALAIEIPNGGICVFESMVSDFGCRIANDRRGGYGPMSKIELEDTIVSALVEAGWEHDKAKNFVMNKPGYMIQCSYKDPTSDERICCWWLHDHWTDSRIMADILTKSEAYEMLPKLREWEFTPSSEEGFEIQVILAGRSSTQRYPSAVIRFGENTNMLKRLIYTIELFLILSILVCDMILGWFIDKIKSIWGRAIKSIFGKNT